jgi:SAM-dependent methyltransferase
MSTTLTTTVEQFRRAVHEEWTDEQTVQAWRHWHPKIVHQLEEMTTALLDSAQLSPGMRVLDLASGTGDPALAVATVVWPDGLVTATDLSPGMLITAEANAHEAGLTNLTFQVADAEDLPFSDTQFDVVLSRIGAMYFVDIQRALSEVRRVLKPGGRVALSAWGPLEKNPYAATMLTPFLTRVDVPPPPPGAPQPMRFAQPGSLATELESAGFSQVSEEALVIMSRWPGPPAEFWQHFYDIAVPFRPVFDGLPPTERAAAVAEVIAGFSQYDDGTHVTIPTAIVIAVASRPAE